MQREGSNSESWQSSTVGAEGAPVFHAQISESEKTDPAIEPVNLEPPVVLRADENGLATDANGDRWIVQSYAPERFIISTPTLRKLINAGQLKSQPGYSATSKHASFIKLADLEALDNGRAAYLRADENGLVTDEHKTEWIVLGRAPERFEVSTTTLRKLVEAGKLFGRPGLASTGQDATLLRIKDLEPYKTDPSKLRTDRNGLAVDKDGVTWILPQRAAKKLGVSRGTVANYAATGRLASRLGSYGANKDSNLIKLADLDALIESRSGYLRADETGLAADAEGDQWIMQVRAAERFNMTDVTLASQAAAAGLVSRPGLASNNQEAIFYKLVELESLFAERTQNLRADEDGVAVDTNDDKWIVQSQAVQRLGMSEPRVNSLIAAGQLASQPGLNTRNRPCMLIKLADVEALASSRSEHLRADEQGFALDERGDQWIMQARAAERFQISAGTLRALSDSGHLASLPGLTHDNRECIFYKLADLEAWEKGRSDHLRANEDGLATDTEGFVWIMHERALRHFGIDRDKLRKWVASSQLTSRLGLSSIGREAEFYKFEDLEALATDRSGYLRADENGLVTDDEGIEWIMVTPASRRFGIPDQTVRNWITSGRLESRPGLSFTNQPVTLCRIQDLEKQSQSRAERHRIRQLEEELQHFALELQTEDAGATAVEFKNLLQLFGGSRAVDILFRFRPEYAKLPIEFVRKVLADYLGDFLLQKGNFRLELVESGLGYLENPDLRSALVENLKEACQMHRNAGRRARSSATDRELIDEFLEQIRTEAGRLQNTDLNSVAAEVEEYYRSIFADFPKPERMVGGLDARREFPDLYQRINIKELADKQRLLIADEMGVGKSASVILAKETLGMGRALMVVPSNVVETWRRYLSDEVSPDGRQRGYFKPGEAPNVLVVERPEDIAADALGAADYVIISQERLSRSTVQQLLQTDWNLLTVDEAHKLKNLKEGQRAACVEQLAQAIDGEGKYLALLSGTPTPNKIVDVAIYLRLLYPERFGNLTNQELVSEILDADMLDLRSLLVPRMEMKSLTDSVEMPPLIEEDGTLRMSDSERVLHDTIVEEDELTASEKIRVLRQLFLNPDLLEPLPWAESSKITALQKDIDEAFAAQGKMLVFVNGYVENVIRGDRTILEKLHLPADVSLRIIDGQTSREERQGIQDEFNHAPNKILLIVSGQTADVGVDFTAAESVVFYNEPWTKYDKRQQLARAYRPGLQHPLKTKTYMVAGTIEEGIHRYIEAKERAIEKLLRGIPVSELERSLLKQNEAQRTVDLEVDADLARRYYSSFQTMMKMFSYAKELGEDRFVEFLGAHGENYADGYAELGSRSYQANANRVSATIIERLIERIHQNREDVRILDLASGPEMLRQHSADSLNRRVFSVDLNEHHFRESSPNQHLVASAIKLPIGENLLDYVHLSMGFHYLGYKPREENWEKLKALHEIHRVLKPDGHVVLNLVYSQDIKNTEQFAAIVQALGFTVEQDLTGIAEAGSHYRSKIVTLRKTGEGVADFDELVEVVRPHRDGLKFRKNDQKIKDTRPVIREFSLNGQSMPIELNSADTQVHAQEQGIETVGKWLIHRYGSVETIPKEEVLDHGFGRFYNGKQYVLIKPMTVTQGIVVVK